MVLFLKGCLVGKRWRQRPCQLARLLTVSLGAVSTVCSAERWLVDQAPGWAVFLKGINGAKDGASFYPLGPVPWCSCRAQRCGQLGGSHFGYPFFRPDVGSRSQCQCRHCRRAAAAVAQLISDRPIGIPAEKGDYEETGRSIVPGHRCPCRCW
ncbi:hypothetical protein D918_01908 [Trichuris suis]|nr:hypothetical protein D918_01908 [Trichuris suis]